MASDINNQDPVSEARRIIYCGSCVVMQKIQKVFAGSVASRTIILVVILAINKNSSICWLSLMASGINNQDAVSESRRFIYCGSC